MSAWLLLRGDASDAVRAALPDLVRLSLDDGSVAVDLDAPLAHDLLELSHAIRRQLGRLVSLVDEPRGLLVFDEGPLACTGYAQAVASVEARGVWVPIGSMGGQSTLEEGFEVVEPEPGPADLVLVVRTLRRSVRVGPDSGLHAVVRLADETALLHTHWPVMASEELEFVLGEWHRDWLEERGPVPAFIAQYLDLARASPDYTTLLRTVPMSTVRPRQLPIGQPSARLAAVVAQILTGELL